MGGLIDIHMSLELVNSFHVLTNNAHGSNR